MKIKKFNEQSEFDSIPTKLSNDLTDALKKFGEYSFDDKGPSDVMDIMKYNRIFHDMPILDVCNVLNKFYEIYPNQKRSASLINEIIIGLDDRIDFDDIFTHDKYNIFEY